MASIDTGGGHGGKKSVDREIPLVPFIDLLLCCVMFLLVTAVWNQLARLDANQQQPGPARTQDQLRPEHLGLILQVQTSGYTLASTAGDRIAIPKNGDSYDQEELVNKLQERRNLEQNRRDIIVAPEDGVRYQDIVQAMDIAVGEGFQDLTLSDGASLL
jgi:biopolymer transport protein ExbD